MSVKKATGYAILAAPFVGIFGALTALNGVGAALLVFAGSGVFVGVIALGVHLTTSG